MMWREINMENVPRNFHFPYPVLSYGCSWHVVSQNYQHFPPEPRLQICVRLSSAEPELSEFIAGEKHEARIPHVAVKLPNTEYHYNVPHRREAIHFFYSGETAGKLKADGLLPNAPYHPLEITPRMTDLVNEFLETMSHTRETGMADRIDLLCFRILEEIMLQPKTGISGKEESREKIMRIASHLRFAVCENIDLKELAREHGFSLRSFFRHWDRCFDKTPAEYIRSLKIEEAKRLLRRTNSSVADIANTLHFGDENYFRSVFRKTAGMTPLQFRKNCSSWSREDSAPC